MDQSGATLIGTIGLVAVVTILTAATMSLNMQMIEKNCMRNWVASQTNQVRLFANAAKSHAQAERETEEKSEGEAGHPDRADKWETTATQVITVEELRNAGRLPPVFDATDDSRYFNMTARVRFNRDGYIQMAVVTRGLPGRTAEPICGDYRKTAELMDRIKTRMATYYNASMRRSAFTPVVIDLQDKEAVGVYETFKTSNPVLHELLKGEDVTTCREFQERVAGTEDFCSDKSHDEHE